MLELQGLTRRFGATVAVDAVSLAVPAGQMLGIIGRSGAGKSTLLRLLNRLVEPSAGRILCDGTDVTALRGRALRRWRRNCAMVFQQFNLVQRLDVLTNALLGRLAYQHGLGRARLLLTGGFPAEERARALAMLERFDLLGLALQRAETLSGGQQQRVALCRALLQAPRLILADEPIASLDPANARLVMQALRQANRAEGLTVLVNLHHLETARAYCDRIVAMQAGRIVFDGPPEALDAARLQAVYGLPEADLAAESEAAAARPAMA
ncbi:phosphonate ABC transporter ATP-binding protein [Roseicella frigidaeris]|uniref:Phosphonate ABC transporter ATP-binding protein n=1 Tax=Roseicella frigidaeris TaxID=2230885 RepID=A0A327MKV1_9PROT|nr:phosphonate ABC transporter ATP-binding protein [Roseicella frigidaeris]RAI60788.1 phosphonate ABC transporter ATP-binding protein [Roseicella frigidaeris]